MGKYIFPIVLVSITIFYFLFAGNKNISQPKSVLFQIGGQTFNLEVAKTESERTIGLSNRTNLCSTCGMIFVFDKPGIYPFWMKDTLIPLDMVWLDKNGQITSIYTAQPEPNSQIWQLKLYKNSIPSQYVIELNANTINQLKLKTGDTIDVKQF